MSSENKMFCSLLLKGAREDALELGMRIPELATWSSDNGMHRYFEVQAKVVEEIQGKTCHHWEQVWAGQAQYATEAKAKAISRMIECFMPPEKKS